MECATEQAVHCVHAEVAIGANQEAMELMRTVLMLCLVACAAAVAKAQLDGKERLDSIRFTWRTVLRWHQ